jgi:hypothetical protein
MAQINAVRSGPLPPFAFLYRTTPQDLASRLMISTLTHIVFCWRRNVLGNETPKLVTPCISDGRLDKDDLKTLFHFETDTESSNSTEHATSNQPAMFAKPAVPALQRASSLPVLPLLPQHSTADALARALRNRLEREKHKDQQKRGQMLRHLRHELYSSTHSTSTHSTLA